jgi:hypothetical protein
MMLAWIECMRNLKDLGVLMSKYIMRDFVTPQERFNSPVKCSDWIKILVDVIAILIIMFLLGSSQSWLI